MNAVRARQGQPLIRDRYTDGDEEDLYREEVQRLLVAPGSSSSSSSSLVGRSIAKPVSGELFQGSVMSVEPAADAQTH